jgi:hypothetical protein
MLVDIDFRKYIRCIVAEDTQKKLPSGCYCSVAEDNPTISTVHITCPVGLRFSMSFDREEFKKNTLSQFEQLVSCRVRSLIQEINDEAANLAILAHSLERG